ncbi:hypothetical protein [Micromonospora sp. HM5-17]|jgi:hypothetical protein|uniref:hypothetical protein n=1 Tax=Micromonospora sp. HM5-17 TaxID=2487710 RepID=UPI0011CEB589|nr:hypothetical protein [Micromonospora sp. HM5-17]
MISPLPDRSSKTPVWQIVVAVMGSSAALLSAVWGGVALFYQVDQAGPTAAHPPVAHTSAQVSISPTNHPTASPGLVGSGADSVRRQGIVTMVRDDVIDLDTDRADWAAEEAPGSTATDLEFTDAGPTLVSVHGAVMALLPADRTGEHFRDCATLSSEYGGTPLPAEQMRPGVKLCFITDQKRVALLRVTNVHRGADQEPEQVTLTVTVWSRRHSG